MTKFEQVGIGFQMDAASKHEAQRSFKYSCNVCCMRGMRIECDRCAIRINHELAVASFEETERKKKRGRS